VPEIGRPPCPRTFITLPNSPLPSSPISTNSRSNLPGCAYASREEHNPLSEVRLSCAPFSCSGFCSCPEVVCGCDCGRGRPVGEARLVTVDASDELDAVLLRLRWLGMLDLSGESLGGMRGGGSCQPTNPLIWVRDEAEGRIGTYGAWHLLLQLGSHPRSYSHFHSWRVRWHRCCSGVTTTPCRWPCWR
jgi:hypothetical protein